MQEPLAPGDIPPIGCPGCPIWETSGNVAGGGALYTEGGPIEILGSTFEKNVATDEGGAISIDNFGAFLLQDSVIRNNLAGADGGGIENSGMRTTFDAHPGRGEQGHPRRRRRSTTPRATQFLVIDSTMQKNVASSGGGFGNAPDADLFIKQSTITGNVARMPGIDDAGQRLDGGEGGGFWSKADGDALIENTTISHNKAGISGGGLFHDADGELRLSQVTIWGNAALAGGGIGVVESDFAPEVPPKANESVILRNSIVGGSTSGGSCDWYITSEGGNVSGGSVPYVPIPGLISSDSPPVPAIGPCFIAPPPGTDSMMNEGERDRFGNARLDALADNGGPTMTNALRYGSLAIDAGLSPVHLDRPARHRQAAERQVRRGRLRVRRPAAAGRQHGSGHGVPDRARPGHARDERLHVHGQRQLDAVSTSSSTSAGCTSSASPRSRRSSRRGSRSRRSCSGAAA